MKKIIYSLAFLFFLSIIVTTGSSCNRGYGCESTENLGVKTDRRGNLSTKRGKSSVMPKSMTKKKRRRSKY